MTESNDPWDFRCPPFGNARMAPATMPGVGGAAHRASGKIGLQITLQHARRSTTSSRLAMTKPSEFINGTCQRFLFGPKGDIEGALIKQKDSQVQVTFAADNGEAFANATGAGKRVRIRAVPDHSPKSASAVHRVYRFECFADISGQAIEPPKAHSGKTKIDGVVAALHFARHGQPNGVILESGEFIHLRPEGMVRTGLEIGSEVRAVGELRMTQLGTPLLQARRVNHIAME
jgi:hypothetical protein